jgi:broad specificity phosphatase PhoE
VRPRARALVLVKHSLPTREPGVPAAQWPLSAEGQQRCGPLAAQLAAYTPATLVSSTELKAQETTALVAARLGLPWTTAPDLHEHDRTGVGWLPEGKLDRRVAAFFAHPAELVFGRETAAAALTRFQAAVTAVLSQRPQGNVLIVAHGTVITLFVAACAGVEPISFWHRLGLPSFVVLSLPDLVLRRTVPEVGVGVRG